jgi:hypothetical protein
MDLAEFLLARIADDEQMAAGGLGQFTEAPPGHWSSDRVLAECAAKRRIVAEHKTIRAAYPGTTIETDPCCITCSAGGEYPGEFPCTTLRLLAAPYASHADYRPEWAPTVAV